jgi:hypothetical protein
MTLGVVIIAILLVFNGAVSLLQAHHNKRRATSRQLCVFLIRA